MDKLGKWIWNLIEMIVRSSIKTVEIITKKSVQEQSIIAFLQFIKFGIVGLSNSVVNYVVYVISLKTFQGMAVFVSSDYLIAQILAFLISVLWAFYWNNKFVFVDGDKTTNHILKALLKTYVSYALTGLLLSEILLIFWICVVGISEYVAPMINILVCLPINFLLNKLWAFKGDENSSNQVV